MPGANRRRSLLLLAWLLMPGLLSGLDLRTGAVWEYTVGSQGQTPGDTAGLAFAPLPSFEGLERLAPGGVGFLWVRATVRLPDALADKELALLLGRMRAAEEVFLNGEKIGEGGRFPPSFFSDWNRSRYYRLTAGQVRPENVLLVKLYVHHEGSISGSLLIDERPKVEREYRFQEFLRVDLNAVVAALLLVMALYHLSIHLQRPRDRYNLSYAIVALSVATYLSSYFVTTIPRFLELGLSYLVFQKIVFAAMEVALYSAGLFIAGFLGRKEPRWFTLAYGILLAAAVALFVAAPDFRIFDAVRRSAPYSLLVPLLYILFILIAGLLRRQPEALAILIGASPLILAMLYDLVARVILRTPGINLTGFGVSTFMVAMLFILSIRFVRNANEADRLNQRLEAEVEDRSSALRVSNARLEQALGELEDANGKLEGLAVTDPLTGVFNRRAFDLRLEEELRRGRRNRAWISLLMIDIDFFKRVNDARGHLCGDQCLADVASTIRASLMRPADFLARYGGEKFVVLLPETPPAGAEQVAQRIRATVEERPIPVEGDPVRLTVSVGVASRHLETQVDKEAVLADADAALSRAKADGRNRVVAAG